MRTDLVVTMQPVARDLPHLLEGIKQVRTQHLFAVSAVEALDVGVLVGLARLNEADLDVLLLAPVGERLTRELRAVVTPNRRRMTVQIDHLREKGDYPGRRNADRNVDSERPTVR